MSLKKAKYVIKFFDLFRTTNLVRYKADRQYETLSGGIVSILLIISFSIIFLQTVLSTFNKQAISSETGEKNVRDPTYSNTNQNPFMFTVGIAGVDLNNAGGRYFDINVVQTNKVRSTNTKTKQIINMIKCQRSAWTNVNSQFGQTFDKLNMEEWLCPQSPLIEFQGKYSSQIFKYVKIEVSQCTNQSGKAPCFDNATVDSLFSSFGSIIFNYYYTNTIINTNSDNFIDYYIEDRNYFEFSKQFGYKSNIFYSPYQVTTDQSLLPYSTYDTKKGLIVEEPTQTFIFKPQSQYIQIYLRKSSLQINSKRQFERYADTFSFIGGLFSFIVTSLYIINLYSNKAYELEIGSRLYFTKDGKQFQSSKFHFLTYIFFGIYKVLNFFNLKFSNKDLQMHCQNQNQSLRQLDFKLIIRRILFLQNSLRYIFDEEQLKCIQLKEKNTIQELAQNRKQHNIKKTIEKIHLKVSKKNQQEKKHQVVNKINQIFIEDIIEIQEDHKKVKNDIPLKTSKIFKLKTTNKIKDKSNIENQKSQKKHKNEYNYSSDSEIFESQNQEEEFQQIEKLIMDMQNLQRKGELGNKRCKKIYENIDNKFKQMIKQIEDRLEKQKELQSENSSNLNELALKQKKTVSINVLRQMFQ